MPSETVMAETDYERRQNLKVRDCDGVKSPLDASTSFADMSDNLQRSRSVMEATSPWEEDASHSAASPYDTSASPSTDSSSPPRRRRLDSDPPSAQLRDYDPSTMSRREVDLRRPVLGNSRRTSAEAPAVIDLTSDTDEVVQATDDFQIRGAASRHVVLNGRGAGRLPRFDRNILDISDDEDTASTRAGAEVIDLSQEDDEVMQEQMQQAPDSPEVEFVSARPLPPHLRQQRQRDRASSSESRRATHRHPTPHHTHFRRDSQGRVELPHIFNFLGNSEQTEGLLQHIRTVDRELQRLNPNAFGMAVPLQQLHVDLNWTTVGFDLGHEQERDTTAPPTYEAPPPAPSGFTRTPAENDILVCPNCGDELCEGKTDQKKQVWVVKKCGHVSCTESLIFSND